MPSSWKTWTTGMPIAGSSRAAGFDSAFEMFLQPRHQLDEIARTKAVVELVDEDAFPDVAAGPRRAGESEEIGAAGDSRRRPASARRSADLVLAEPAEELPKPANRPLL